MVCFGHSHAMAILAAAAAEGRELAAIVLDVEDSAFDWIAGRLRFKPDVAARLKDEVVLSCVGGNSHTVLGLVRHPTPFDFVLPEAPHLSLDPNAQLVPYGVIRHTLKAQMTPYLEVLAALAEVTHGRVFHAESPPPPGDDDYIAANLTEPFVDAAAFGVAPRALRYKLWRLHSAIARETCDALGFTFLGRPDESVDEAGFLKCEFYGNITHANAAYGALVLRQLEALL